jgi:hypothetical protein
MVLTYLHFRILKIPIEQFFIGKKMIEYEIHACSWLSPRLPHMSSSDRSSPTPHGWVKKHTRYPPASSYVAGKSPMNDGKIIGTYGNICENMEKWKICENMGKS